jgi:hypothetical protein
MCKRRFGMQLLQNPPLCISTVEWTYFGAHWSGFIKSMRIMVCFMPFINMWLDSMAKLLSILLPWAKIEFKELF